MLVRKRSLLSVADAMMVLSIFIVCE
uniref:Uncharacterized protein n=1 Tax=Arundo donax TaxID=35708 RepID=A0A0A9H5F0_ARUDO